MRKLRRDERGISTVIAVVSLLGIFGAALLSVDAGNMWTTRRQIITGTDATALDRARTEVGSPGSGCALGWQNDLAIYSTGFVVNSENCAFHTGTVPGTGWLSVEAQKEAQTRFGGLFGLGNTTPYSFSAAQIYYPLTLEGLRPIGICIGNHHLQDEWIPYQNYLLNRMSPPPSTPFTPEMTPQAYQALATSPGGDAGVSAQYPNRTGPVHRISYSPDQAEDLGCGNDPGNWGWQDFQGGSPSEAELIDWVLNGFDGEVGIDDCDADGEQTSGETGDGCAGGPGGGGGANPNCRSPVQNLGEALNCMVGRTFPIVIYDDASCTTPNQGQPSGGNNCTYHTYGFLGVILRGFDIATGQSNRYFDFEFVSLARTGRCCAQNPNQTGVRAIRLCEVDHDVSGLTEAQRCGQ